MTHENTRRFLIPACDSSYTGWSPSQQAIVIEANPAALLNAMVADGMARAVVWCPAFHCEPADADCEYADRHFTRYEVVSPEPTVDTDKQTRDRFFPNNTLDCASCGVQAHKAQRLRHAQWHEAWGLCLPIEISK